MHPRIHVRAEIQPNPNPNQVEVLVNEIRNQVKFSRSQAKAEAKPKSSHKAKSQSSASSNPRQAPNRVQTGALVELAGPSGSAGPCERVVPPDPGEPGKAGCQTTTRSRAPYTP